MMRTEACGREVMSNIRFLGAATALFVAAFLGVKWLLTPGTLRPDSRLPTFYRVDTNSPRYKLEQSSVTDGDPTRDRLRVELVDYAQALAADPCNAVLKKYYIEAANNYARAWLSIVPCLATITCSGADSARIELAQHAFGTPMDRRVREAMRQLHAKGLFKLGDFPDDTAFLVAELAEDGLINPRVASAMTEGPTNAQNPPRPNPSFAEIQAQLGYGQPPPSCEGK
jgi:hypothetical protein